MNMEQNGDTVSREKESATQLESLQRENERLTAELEALRAENKRWEELATKDPLTGTLNRRGLGENVKYLIAHREKEQGEQRQEGKKKTVAILMLDVDNFKIVNDAYSHEAGDQVLRDLTRRLKELSRDTDMVCRWGGEEFVVAFWNASAQDIINKFYDRSLGRAAVKFETEIDGKPIALTLSGGVTELRTDETLDKAVDRADELLYAAKETGKDRIEKEGDKR
jgi:diguanylate cyclase (GGDEF)-like protein